MKKRKRERKEENENETFLFLSNVTEYHDLSYHEAADVAHVEPVGVRHLKESLAQKVRCAVRNLTVAFCTERKMK